MARLLEGVGLEDLATLYAGDTGIETGELWRLLGYEYQLPDLAPPPPAKPPEKQFLESSPEITSSTEISLGGFQPLYWKILSVTARNNTEKEPIPTPVSLAPPDPEHPDTPAEVQVTISAVQINSDMRWWQLASSAVQVPEPHLQQTARRWRRALERAEVPSATKKDLALRETGEVWIVLDYAWRLMPWWNDIRHVGKLLHRRFGSSRAKVVVVEDGVCDEQETAWPSGETQILVFSDLAQLGDYYARRRWAGLTRQWRQRGIGVTVFSPAPDSLLSSSVGDGVKLLPWERHQGKNDRIVKDLLACLSTVQWCSPALLRAWRKMLGGSLADEYALWRHENVNVQPDACFLVADIALHRQHFKSLDSAIKQRLMAAVAPCRPYPVDDVLMEEALIRRTLGVSDERAALAWLNELVAAPGLADESTQEWLWRLSERQEESFWETYPALEQLCTNARAWLATSESSFSLGPGMSKPPETNSSEAMDLAVCIRGTRLILQDVSAQINESDRPCAELLRIKSANNGIRWQVLNNVSEPYRVLKSGAVLPVDEGQVAHWRLTSDFQTLELRQAIKPSWAIAIEQTPEGLFCEPADHRRLRWCYPGETSDAPFDPLTSGDGMARAAWVDEVQLQRFKESALLPYLPGDEISSTSRAISGGQDQYGQYADLEVERVTFRLRWIPPGEFWMGSPETEAERNDNEARHKVIISQGYWLAETACTQTLWQVVMGENPSRFKGDDLPVETVSWDEIQTFCQKLNKLLPNLEARLPSEAEWEYACRAGTETVFWWGDELSTELANYDGDYPYANGPKGKDRNKTLPVKHFKPNPWGLYQVHGNVDEWCADRYGDYPEKEVVNPVGPADGAWRVLRGGGWSINGWWLRAAFRSHDTPGFRFFNLGFRLAIGPRPGGARSGRGAGGESER